MFLSRTHFRVTVFILFFLLYQSCSNVLIPEFEVIDIRYDSEKISVIFSKDVDAEKVKKSFVMTENCKISKGTFCINGNVVDYYPYGGIKINYDYEVSISTQAEDENGKSLKEIFFYSFSTKKDKTKPVILNINPTNGEILEKEIENIEIIFSKSIDKESFLNAFSIEPSIDYSVNCNDDKTKYEVKFMDPLNHGVIYTVQFSTELKDLYNNYLVEEFSSKFEVMNDHIPPDFEISFSHKNNDFPLNEFPLENHEVPCNSEITLLFNEKIDLSYFGSYIDVFPSSTKYSYEADRINENKVLIKINGSFNEACTLKIKKGIEDKSGNKTNTEKKYLIIFDNESFRPVSFIKGYIQNSGKNNYKELSYETQYTELNLDPEYYGNDRTQKESELFLIFKTSKKCEGIDYFSIIDALSFKTTNSCCSILIKKAEIIQPEELGLLLSEQEINENNLSIIRFILYITNTNKNGLVEMSLSNSIKDLLGNKIDHSYTLAFNK